MDGSVTQGGQDRMAALRQEMLALAAKVHGLRPAGAAAARACIAVSGPGATGISALMEVSGASNTVLHASVPYSREAYHEYSQTAVENPQYASADAASHLARDGLLKGLSLMTRTCSDVVGLADGKLDAIGVGSAGAISTSRDRRGANVCHTSACRLHRDGRVAATTAGVGFRKGLRDRSTEEQLSGALLVSSLANIIMDDPAPFDIVRSRLEPGGSGASTAGTGSGPGNDTVVEETLQVQQAVSDDPLDVLLRQASSPPSAAPIDALSRVSHVLYVPSSTGQGPTVIPNAPLHEVGWTPATHGRHRPPVVILPGSFNPLHGGHERMAMAAARALEKHEQAAGLPARPYSVVFELSAANVDKPPLGKDEVLRRVAQFAPPEAGSGTATTPAVTGVSGQRWPVVVTSAPRFLEKAALFPGCAFVIGFDTACRLVHPKYYGHDPMAMMMGLMGVVQRGTRFVVAGRVASAAPLVLPEAMSSDTKADSEPVTPDTFLTYVEHLQPRLHPLLRDAFVGLSEADFREDISSTQLRAMLAARSAE